MADIDEVLPFQEPQLQLPAAPLTGGPAARPRKRGRIALGFAVLCVVAAASGVVAARFVKSPAAVAALTAPPPPTQLTAPVVREVLSGSVVTRGTVVSGGEVTADPASELGASLLVVTADKARTGESVYPGMVVAEISGRPLIALPGVIRAYRNLTDGDSGPDVTQLQNALAELGYGSGTDAAGTFGRGTERALAALYAGIGYQPAGGVHHAYLPMAEVVYVPSFPARIQQVASRVGEKLGGPAVTVSYGKLGVTADVDPSQSSLVRRGSRVVLVSAGSQVSEPAIVSRVEPEVSGRQTGPEIPVRIRSLRQLPASWLGQNVQVTITSAQTATAVLVVPVSAISTTADGQVSVSVVRPGGQVVIVPVIAGASSGGFVAVRPTRAGGLQAGERVIVGAG
ncbi:MAG TPA: peptidoglycan-binding protein [Streptosporangiaceae bacterium]|nr:peptidoglycan-binding protein [Streptosporangiaceae bacterium]